jgi:CRISPR-associated endonuclease/helicase Cas3
LITATSLTPGDTIIVPATYGGIRSGCFDPTSTDAVMDRAEQANFFARARPVLRLQPAVTDGLEISLPLDDPEEARDSLGRLAANGGWPAWKRLWAQKLAKGRGSLVVAGDPRWTVLEAKRVPLVELQRVLQPEETLEDGVELTTDGDDSFHAGRAVSLSEHSADVEEFARGYALRCGLGARLAEHFALAAWLHDIGKADRRFQLMLRGGSEIEYFKDETLWAKSAMPPGAREAHRLAQQRSGYPSGARHEVQSLAMLEGRLEALTKSLKKVDYEREPDVDLVLHLVASHHGYCRPFAPVVIDDAPVEISLTEHASKQFDTLDFCLQTSRHQLHRIDSALGDRFWTLIEKYGWHELCWLESILRLADHRASEEEQNANADA